MSGRCKAGRCGGRFVEARECPRGWREVWSKRGTLLHCQRGTKKLTWDAAWKRREAREARKARG